ncbi:MAG: queuosine precursor transporter [Cytophagaceae bacterium]|jgi:hypothetical protein|nr:queuosine precursor transporter [Cytophagaceae bacterium]
MNNTESRKQALFVLLAALLITNALVAEIIGSKIFSLEASLGIKPSETLLFGVIPFQFNMTAGVILWPFVFILTDLVNEYFGPKGVRRISLITAGCIAYAFCMLYIAIQLTPAGFWVSLFSKDPHGNSLDIDYAYSVILGQGLNIIAASIVTFLLGQLADALLFDWLKKKTGEKYIWLRATGSTLVSQLLDSFVILMLAFYVFPARDKAWTLSLVVTVACINYCYKVVMAVALTPLIYLAHARIDAYLNKAALNRN